MHCRHNSYNIIQLEMGGSSKMDVIQLNGMKANIDHSVDLTGDGR